MGEPLVLICSYLRLISRLGTGEGKKGETGVTTGTAPFIGICLSNRSRHVAGGSPIYLGHEIGSVEVEEEEEEEEE